MRIVTFKVEEDLLEQLDAIAIRNKITRSEAIRRAIDMLVKEEQKKTKTQIKIEKGFKVRGR